MNHIRISQKMKNKGYLSIEKDITKCKKICYQQLKWDLSYQLIQMNPKLIF